FLRFWYRRDLLPTLALTELPPTPAELVEEIDAAGFEPIAVVMPGPGGVAVLGAFAFQRDGRFPYVFCAAGSGLGWEAALTAGLWELVNIIRTPRDRTHAEITAALADRWDVRTIDDHIDYYLLPDNGIRVRAKCGGPRLTLPQLTSIAPDPALPQTLSALDLIETITERLHRAGLGEPVFIDQGNVEL
ncbi:YcaO-like family protein, partial [Nocardia gipuzkoensis]